MKMIRSLYDRWSGLPLKTKLLRSYILIAMLPMIFFGYYVVSASRAYVITNAETALRSMIDRSRELASQNLERLETIMGMCAYHQDLQRVYRNQFTNSYEQYVGVVEKLEGFYANIFAANDRILKELCFFSFRGLSGTGPYLNSKADALQRVWYPIAATHLGRSAINWCIDDTQCFAFMWLYDYGRKDDTPLGLLYCEINLPEFISQSVSLNWHTWQLRITSPAGTLHHAVGSSKQLQRAIWKPFSYSLGNGWLFEYQAAIEGGISANMLFISGFAAVAVLILLMMPLIIKISHSMVSGIQALTRWVCSVQSGKMDTPLLLRQKDEIGALGDAFQSMLQQIQVMMEDIREKERRHADLELRALRAQIDPHFLHNTLSYMNWCAIKNGDEEMSSIIGHLAVFYRTCLNGGRDFITVEQEMNNVMSYIEIQKALHRHTFTASFHVAQEVKTLKMLCFLLQPLAENAVIHGIDQRTEDDSGGNIFLSASLEDGFLVITIEDNGPGMPPIVQQEGITELPPSEKYGIRYVVRRIRLEYGEAASLSFASLRPSGTRAMLRLPVRL